jgi:hypothetical protein
MTAAACDNLSPRSEHRQDGALHGKPRLRSPPRNRHRASDRECEAPLGRSQNGLIGISDSLTVDAGSPPNDDRPMLWPHSAPWPCGCPAVQDRRTRIQTDGACGVTGNIGVAAVTVRFGARRRPLRPRPDTLDAVSPSPLPRSLRDCPPQRCGGFFCAAGLRQAAQAGQRTSNNPKLSYPSNIANCFMLPTPRSCRLCP